MIMQQRTHALSLNILFRLFYTLIVSYIILYVIISSFDAFSEKLRRQQS